MARTRMATGNTSHAPEIFKNHNVPKKYGGSKGQPPAKAPGQGKHHGGGYAPGATAGNLVTKGNLNIPSFMYKPYNKKPFIGKHHLYSYVPPVSHIADPAKRTHMPAPGTVSSIANPATRTHMAAPETIQPVSQQQGFSGKNQMRPSSGPNINAPIIAAIWYPFQVIARAGGGILRSIFRLGGTQPYRTGRSIPGQEGPFYGEDWHPSSYYGLKPGESPYWFWETPPTIEP